MKKVHFYNWLTTVFAGTLLLGCSVKIQGETTPIPAPKAHIGEFSTLTAQPFLKASLPLVLDYEKVEVAGCLAPSESLEPLPPTEPQIAALEKNKGSFESAIKGWLTELLAETGISQGVIVGWKIEPIEYHVLSVHPAYIGFVQEPGCLDDEKRQLDPSLSIVNTLYGAQKFLVTAPVEFDIAAQQKMLEFFEQGAALVETAAYHYYQPALEASGEPKKNFEGENLYTSKDGELIPESQVPPNGERPMKEWSIAFDEPYFFAGAEYVPEWKNEADAEKCDVYLIWDDPSPQVGECDEFSQSGFAVSFAEENQEISLMVTTDGETAGATLKYDETMAVRANNRVVVWVTPKQIEEGVLLKVDSYVLRPVIEEPEKPAKKKVASKNKKKKNKKKNKNKRRRAKRTAKNDK